MRRRGILAAAILCVTTGSAVAASDENSAPALTIAGAVEQYFVRAHELMVQALSLMGIRYRYGGDTPVTGFDCSGFVRYVFNQIGTALPRSASDISRIGRTVDRDELQPGDLVFFNTLRRPFSHVGIYLGEQRFIHAPSGGGSVEIVNITERYWERRYNGARRLDL
jgi:cell wall-associated NlpC family hydrolase